MLTGHYTSKNFYEDVRGGIHIGIRNALKYARSSIYVRIIVEEDSGKFRKCLVKYVVIIRAPSGDLKILVQYMEIFGMRLFGKINIC